MSKTIGIYSIGELIGKGNYGEVYKAVNTQTGEIIAVKMIDRSRMTERLQNALVREIQVMTRITSPYLVRLIDTKKTKRFYYLFLEFCYGGDLDVLIKKKGPVSEEVGRRWLLQLIEAVEALQAQKILHRDLKLANILLTSENVEEAAVKIGDFGFARFLTDSLAGTQCGSPLYMAPEIFESKPKYGHKADIWGVGTIVYEMLTGQAAFQCTGLRELIQLHERGFKIPTGVQLSAPAADLVSRMLDRNPATRIDIAGIRAHPFVTGVEAPAEPEPPTAPDQGSLDIIGEELNESDNHVSTEQLKKETPNPQPDAQPPEEVKQALPVVEPSASPQEEEKQTDVPTEALQEESLPQPEKDSAHSVDIDDFEIIDSVDVQEGSDSDQDEPAADETTSAADFSKKQAIEIEFALKTILDSTATGRTYYDRSELVIAYAIYYFAGNQLDRLAEKVGELPQFAGVLEEIMGNRREVAGMIETIAKALAFTVSDITESLMAIDSTEAAEINPQLLLTEAQTLYTAATSLSPEQYVEKVETCLQALQIAEIGYELYPSDPKALELVERLDELLKELTY